MQLGSMMFITDANGDPFAQYNSDTMQVFDMNGLAFGTTGGSAAFYDPSTDQILFTDPSRNDASTGTVTVTTSAPPPDPIAAGIDPAAIVKTASGALYTYKQISAPGGQIQYQAVPYSGGGVSGLLSNPLMLGAAALMLVAFTKGK